MLKMDYYFQYPACTQPFLLTNSNEKTKPEKVSLNILKFVHPFCGIKHQIYWLPLKSHIFIEWIYLKRKTHFLKYWSFYF